MQTLINKIKSLEYHLGNNKDVDPTGEDKHSLKAKRKTWKVSSLFKGPKLQIPHQKDKWLGKIK